MSIKAVLFDLDGTLLPMDQDEFVRTYFGLLAKKLAPHGYESKELIDAIWKGTKAMIQNAGEQSNEETFWQTFSGIFGERAKDDIGLFEEFYRNEFAGAKAVCGYNPQAAETVRMIKEMGVRVALATNPIFPGIATENRMRWAGFEPEDFELYTTYENSNYCKPNLRYYMDVLDKMQVKPEECIMVGNDVADDMVVTEMGMKVFLLTDCLINKDEKDISCYPNGNFAQLQSYIGENVRTGE